MDAVVGLGANLGERAATLAGAILELSQVARIVAVSALYETEPVGPPGPLFLNAAVRLEFDGTPQALLSALLQVEAHFGRVRRERWGPRTLDMDLLWIAGVVVSERGLVVPHPGLAERRFALAPLLDVAADAHDPVTGDAIAGWLCRLPEGGIRRIDGPGWATSLQPTAHRVVV